MNRPVVSVALLAVLAAIGVSAAAENKSSSLPEYRVTRWSVEEGLPLNRVMALVQTGDGYLWVGTLKGLARFDGWRFRVFDHETNPEFKHDSINALAVDKRDGGLWIGTGEGLFYYHDHQFNHCGLKEGITGPVGVLCPDPDGGMWFSSRNGQLSLARAGQVETWEFGPDREDNMVHQLGVESASTILLLIGKPGSTHTLHRFNLKNQSLTRVRTPSGETWQAGHCLSFLQEADESLSLCTGQGIWRGREDAWQRITHADPVSAIWPERIIQTRDGQNLVTLREQKPTNLRRLVRGQLEPFTAPALPSDLNVSDLLEDREGNLWVGTALGLIRMQPKRIKVYSQRDGLPSDDTQAVAVGAGGVVWVGTVAGISSITSTTITNLPPAPTNAPEHTVSMRLVSHDGRVWGTCRFAGVRVFQDGDWLWRDKHYAAAIGEDRLGRVWIGAGGGVFPVGGEQNERYSTTNGLSHTDVRVIYQDHRGDMWFGTFGGGLNWLHEGKITVFKSTGSERNNRMWWIHEDADGVFWVATEDGLNRFVPPIPSPGLAASLSPSDGERDGVGHFFTFTKRHGLVEPVINNIQEDDFGYLWLSGLKGIHRVSRAELNEVAAGRREKLTCVTFGTADGLLNSECNGGDNQPSGCKDQVGRIWFPTVEGVAVIDPQTLQRVDEPPPVVIEQVRANDEVVFGDGRIQVNSEPGTQNSTLHLPPGHGRVIEIHYTANSLFSPERVRFKCRLEGHDRDWLSDDQNRRVAFYTNLRPGDYTFRVMACNSHGLWNEAGDQFAFHVAPHFYETWWFYLLCATAVLVSAAGVQTYRLRWQRRLLKLDEQRSLATERTRIARDLHDDLGTALTGLALELDVLGRETNAPRSVTDHLGGTARRTRDLAERMREVVWTVNPQCDTLSSLASFLEQQISQFLRATDMRIRLEFPEDIPATPLAAPARHQLALSVREALTNVVRHAQASEVLVTLATVNETLILQVKDNGCGFDAEEPHGHGLENMRTRLQQVGGHFECVSTPGSGTVVEFRLPLKQPAAAEEFPG